MLSFTLPQLMILRGPSFGKMSLEVLKMDAGNQGTRTLLTTFPLLCIKLLVTAPILVLLDARRERG